MFNNFQEIVFSAIPTATFTSDESIAEIAIAMVARFTRLCKKESLQIGGHHADSFWFDSFINRQQCQALSFMLKLYKSTLLIKG
jgi:hypothetical protein